MTVDELLTSRITVYSHFENTGACEELRDWLRREKAGDVTYIAFPFLRSRSHRVEVEHFGSGRNESLRSLTGFKKPAPLSYIKDFIYALIYGIRFARGSDVLVAGDSLLAVAGVVLRRLGIVRKVVYYMIDYTPVRFGNSLINFIYLTMDRFACRHSNQVWALSERMITARFEDGRVAPKEVNWQVVPYGNHPIQIDAAREIARTHVGYMGTLMKNKGAELFVPTARQMVARGIDVRFIVVGDGDYAAEMKADAQAAGISDRFEFKGYVDDITEALKIVAHCGVAIAPYNPHDKNSFTYYADPGKLKLYLGCGLPIVLTDVPQVARTISESGAGLIAAYTAEDLADKICRVITADGYDRYRENARRLGAMYNWPTVFTNAFDGLP